LNKSEEISTSSELFSFIVNNAFDAIIYYTPVRGSDNNIIDFELTFINDTILKHHNSKREDYTGKTFLSLFPYAIKDGMFDAFKNVCETGIPSEGVYYYEDDKFKGWYRSSAVKYDKGIIVYFRDVSEKEFLEQKLKEKNKELEKLLNEKENLLKEVNHRIKNNLQLLVGMLHLQSESINDPQLKELLNTASQRIITVAKIHQKLYERANVFSIDLTLFIKEIIDSVQNLYKKSVEIKYDIDDINLPLDYLVNVSLIINELITNAFKHAFNESNKGEIYIFLKQEENNIKLIIRDNGKGIENFDLEKGDSLGLLLIKSFVEQMSGTLEINNSPATFQIIFPLAEN